MNSALVLLSENDKKAVSTFWTTNADGVQWSMIFFLLLAIVGSFAVNQGDWLIESTRLRQGLSIIQFALCAFVAYRMVVPCGTQDIKALIAIALIPGLGCTERALILAVVGCPVLAFRWRPSLRLVGLASMIVISIMFRNLSVLDNIAPIANDNAVLICSSDKIYKLYHSGNVYNLVREMEFTPGVKLVKHLDSMKKYTNSELRISKSGSNYSIEEINPPAW